MQISICTPPSSLFAPAASNGGGSKGGKKKGKKNSSAAPAAATGPPPLGIEVTFASEADLGAILSPDLAAIDVKSVSSVVHAGFNFTVDEWMAQYPSARHPVTAAVQKSGARYVMGFVTGDDATRAHEWAHFAFALSPRYEQVVRGVLSSPSHRGALRFLTDSMGYQRAKVVDEAQAFALTEPHLLGVHGASLSSALSQALSEAGLQTPKTFTGAVKRVPVR
jgi:hypothetical protein